ncbi:MAG TPA: hypothetical protein VEY09_10185 [Pyrinomonadaceae bacterium]|nr:hypothetical protein [Pyrinomonadaceae bacterium]
MEPRLVHALRYRDALDWPRARPQGLDDRLHAEDVRALFSIRSVFGGAVAALIKVVAAANVSAGDGVPGAVSVSAVARGAGRAPHETALRLLVSTRDALARRPAWRGARPVARAGCPLSGRALASIIRALTLIRRALAPLGAALALALVGGPPALV